MTDETRNAETPRQKLAHAARRIDMQASSDSARNATQYAIIINGGAATAILSFLSKSHAAGSQLDYAAAGSLVGYAIGVCFAAVSMWCSSQASARFGSMWEAFLDGDTDWEKRFRDEGVTLVSRHRNFFTVSILLFLISTAAMAWGLSPLAG
jgi:hypothetical protein